MAFHLTWQDREVLKKIVREYLREATNTTGRPEVKPDNFPTVGGYICFTPEGGIPALSYSGTTGTGTTAASDDVPGQAFCQVYKIGGTPESPEMMEVSGLTIRVYNFLNVTIPAGKWVFPQRDKFGNWVLALGLDFGSC